MPTTPAFTGVAANAPRRNTVASKSTDSLTATRASFLRGRALRTSICPAPLPNDKTLVRDVPTAPVVATAAAPGIPIQVREVTGTALSLGLTIGAELAASRALAAVGVAFPGSLAAMLSLLLFITLLRAARLTRAAETVRGAFVPGAAFLARWLAVFFVPNLVMLPLAPRLPGADVVKIGVILVVGLLASLLSTAGAALLLRAAAARARGGAAIEATSETAKPAPPSRGLVAGLLVAAAAALPFAAAEGAAGAVVAMYMLAATVLAFCVGQRFPRTLRTVVHPLVSCTAGALGAVALLGAVSGAPFADVLAGYYVRDAGATFSKWGAGNILAALLGPAVVSFAIQMDGRRKLMRLRGGELVGTSLIATIAGLFGTAGAARMLGMSETARLMVVPRMITAPLALAIVDMLGAEAGIALSVVALTGLLGANIAAPLLSMVGVKDPVVRGLATGAAAHGLGTAAMADEPAAFPFAAVAMTLVGIFSTCFVAYPPIRALLVRVALGTAKITSVP